MSCFTFRSYTDPFCSNIVHLAAVITAVTPSFPTALQLLNTIASTPLLPTFDLLCSRDPRSARRSFSRFQLFQVSVVNLRCVCAAAVVKPCCFSGVILRSASLTVQSLQSFGLIPGVLHPSMVWALVFRCYTVSLLNTTMGPDLFGRRGRAAKAKETFVHGTIASFIILYILYYGRSWSFKLLWGYSITLSFNC